MIISASRRTDIPAFFMRWFMHCVQQGEVHVQNPFNAKQVRCVSLKPEDVDVLVFWTRDARNMLAYTAELENMGFRFYVHYTLTGYPSVLEPHVPGLDTSLETFHALSGLLGPGRVIWRYDPVLVTSLTPIAEHKRIFKLIVENLAGRTKRVVVSFADFYTKTRRNLAKIPTLSWEEDIPQEDIMELVGFFVSVAKDYDLDISSCAEPLVSTSSGIRKGACIDATIIREEFGILTEMPKDKNQRKGCLCLRSVDIGVYNTCAFGCAYCYATVSPAVARENRKKHFLIDT